MHKWESTEKLLSEWDNQDIGEKFVYSNFTYERDEFDNVPPVVPRFLFYLQLNLKPVVKQLYDDSFLQSTADLRAENIKWNEELRQSLEEKERQL